MKRQPSSSEPVDDRPRIARSARVLLTLVLITLGRSAFRSEYGEVPLLGDIDLAIHEFGHILFTPFGDTMMVLGGSLTQVTLPLAFAGCFLIASGIVTAWRGRNHRPLARVERG